MPIKKNNTDSRKPIDKKYKKKSKTSSSQRHDQIKKVNKDSHKPFDKKNKSNSKTSPTHTPEEQLIRLNRFIANAGICSRREADKLIESGIIKVNGTVTKELGTKVSRSDKVQYDEQVLKSEKKYYVLLNKPKGFITTTDDPYERRTVMSLVKNACKERIYPVGRLDKNTTGLLLFTNDGDLAKKLTHPKHEIKKIYHIVLDKNLTTADFQQIAQGLKLEDGPVKVDAIAYVAGAENKKEIGIEIHSGKNRIIRRIFESLNYRVLKLDRVAFAGLTKKDIPRGKWRFLSEKEVSFLIMK